MQWHTLEATSMLDTLPWRKFYFYLLQNYSKLKTLPELKKIALLTIPALLEHAALLPQWLLLPPANCWHSELHPYNKKQAESIQKSNGKTIKMYSENKQWEEGNFKDSVSVLGFSGQNESLISFLKSISLSKVHVALARSKFRHRSKK